MRLVGLITVKNVLNSLIYLRLQGCSGHDDGYRYRVQHLVIPRAMAFFTVRDLNFARPPRGLYRRMHMMEREV